MKNILTSEMKVEHLGHNSSSGIFRGGLGVRSDQPHFKKTPVLFHNILLVASR